MSTLNKTEYSEIEINKPRSVFDLDQRHIMTMAIGKLTPILCEEVLPGDTWTMDTASMIRAAAPFVSPVYGDLTLSLYAFFVPNRLIWNHWFQFCGQNDQAAWTEKKDYLIPKSNPLLQISPGSIGDSLGIPQFYWQNDGKTLAINELPLRGYVKIWNDWFRNQNTQAPVLMTYEDEANTTYTYDSELLTVNKFHDRYTDCLPSPQKGEPVSIGLAGLAPLKTDLLYDIGTNVKIGAGPDMAGGLLGIDATSGRVGLAQSTSEQNTTINANPVHLTNLYADLSKATATTINQLRMEVKTQAYLELLATGGSRYNELIYSLFGVQTGDTRAYRPELLGGVHVPLNMQEVVANSSSADNSKTQYALGQQVVKLTNGDDSSLCTASFTEHGYIYILACVRRQNQYYQGLERKWKRNTFLDFYNPMFDTIGEQPIYQNELDLSWDNATTDTLGGQTAWDDTGKQVFGYQEAWIEYRTFKDYITGAMVPSQMKPGDNNSLPTYTFAQTLNKPTLAGLMPEDRKSIQRTMALTDLPYDLMCDFVTHGKVARCMSVRSTPSLTDGF